ncbi:MAG: hypothetical protein IKU72_01215 [Oscillospiraceae bacterium]|nr:hypothetical protein [Oscillospiraceae bacterium]
MRQTLLTIAAVCLCLMLVLCGCQRQSSARQAFEEGTARVPAAPQKGDPKEEEAPEEEQDPFEDLEQPEPDSTWYANRYIVGLSLQRLEDFETPADLPANDLAAFFFMANYDGEDKLPIPEGYRSNTDGSLRLPGDEVESFVMALMDGVEESHLRASQYYNEDKHIYELNGFGITSGGSRVEVTDAQTRDDRVELVFDVYSVLTDAQGEELEIGPISTRCAAFLDQGDRFKVLSLQTLFQADMDKLMREAGLI